MKTTTTVAPRRAPPRRVPILSRHWLLAMLVLVAGAMFSSAQAAQLQVGDLTPRLEIKLIDGKTLSAQALRSKVVLHMFWATWCPFCLADMPQMQKLQDKYRDSGLVVVAISLDKDREDVLRYLGEHRYTLPVAMRSRDIREEFGAIRGTPTYFLSGRNGVVRFQRVGTSPDPGELEQRIRQLLSELP